MSNQVEQLAELLRQRLRVQADERVEIAKKTSEYKKLEKKMDDVEKRLRVLQVERSRLIGEDKWNERDRVVENFKMELLQAKLLSEKKSAVTQVLQKYGLFQKQIEVSK